MTNNQILSVSISDGDFLDLYENFTLIHGGGEGSIIKASRKADGKTVALKKYFRGGIKTADDWENAEIAAGRERIFLERAARDRVENVPVLLGYGTTNILQEAVVAMEYLEGRTLDAVINSHGFIPDITEAVRIATEAAKPLKYAHEQLSGFVHRDIKPANIIIGNDGKVTVIDWSTLRDRGLTLKNTQLYSPNYTAPEVLEGRSVTPSADIYSLGKTLEHCLLGALFEEKRGEITREDLERKNLPAHLIKALEKATKSEPSQRYQKIDDLIRDLNRQELVIVERKEVVRKEEVKAAITSTELTTEFGWPVTYKREVADDFVQPIGLLSIISKVGGEQGAVFGAALNIAREVGIDQFAFLGAALNIAHEVGGCQKADIGAALNIAHKVGGYQFAGIGAAVNIAHEVGGYQGAGIGAAVNIAHEVGKNQCAGIGAVNIAREVGESQYTLFGLAVNVAKRVGKSQYGLVNIVTEELGNRQVGIINYADGREFKQYGLLNLRPGKKWKWNLEISLGYYHRKVRGEK